MSVSVYDVECPRCGSRPTEPCWHLQIGDVPLKWPHAERDEARDRVARYLAERGCEHPRPLDVKTAIAALDAMSRG